MSGPFIKGIVLYPSPESSLEQLITAGCDNRIVAGADGLNRYGCGPLPRHAIPFGSCTCSSPSTRAISHAESALSRLRLANDVSNEADRIADHHRERLIQLLELPESVDVAFSPSGTDAELLALALVMMRYEKPVTNLVVGPSEVGSGTPLAAAAKHYDTVTPSGRHVTKGTPLCDRIVQDVAVNHIDIRDDRGDLLDAGLVDAAVVDAVSEAVAAGRQVLLHVVAHSKTGVHAPSLRCVSQICRHLGHDVSVVVDAAQGRIGTRRLGQWLNAGHQVIFTGSKFYGGPPFSGALLVPPALRPVTQSIQASPILKEWTTALGDYLMPADLPSSWTGMRTFLPGWVNHGSLLRWAGAIAEIEAYHAVPETIRADIFQAFRQAVPKLLGDFESIELLPGFRVNDDDDDTTSPEPLDTVATVFPFRVRGREHRLTGPGLKQLHRRLNDSSQWRSTPSFWDNDRSAFHLGQPVTFRDGSAALRVALGGELVVRLATDETLGRSLDARLDWLARQLIRLGGRIDQWVYPTAPALRV